MVRLTSKIFFRCNSNKFRGGGRDGLVSNKGCDVVSGEIKWELRPGGMLVQKRENGGSTTSSSSSSGGDDIISLRVSTVSKWHDISIEATSTFGELKIILSLVTGLEPKEQRLLFKGKEREDRDYLHMVGVKNKDKVLLLEDPAIKEMKLNALGGAIANPCNCTISV
ncbi:hypothetical protein GIB67_027804 [Kingdonia uniflora]|uniref:Ubiquitin-like domain-containing protein n=1 Tax=Kingdonia uniflora TaxID=39325 RepID=A0A7J7PD98_9MAGN|nr:hypothetical protein GIB67_027804 [Kingdonia uniflora]